MNNFKIISKDKQARVGVLKTVHGEVQTPIYMPVGTQATVKALTPKDLKTVGAQIILGNTYHLYLRPGSKLVKKMGGLHKFMGWDGPILTDSGGFQAFSLGAMIEHGVRKIGSTARGPAASPPAVATKSPHQTEQRVPVGKINEEGVHFVSHLDGSKHLLTPEKSIEVQLDLGSDICLVLDELLSPVHGPKYVKESLERTHRWELRSLDYFIKHKGKEVNSGTQIFGIVQGVTDKIIRENEARWIGEQNFSGVSIGGSFGNSEFWSLASQGPTLRGWDGDAIDVDWAASQAIYQTMSWVVPLLPDIWPKHALGIGEVRDIFECVERGIDMFDCVAPTRRARNGSLYISPKNGGNIKNHFALSILRSEFTDDKKPIDPGCECYTCQNFSRSYLRHLFLAKELLYFTLASIHNVYFMLNLTKQIREAISDTQFIRFKESWIF